MSPYHQSLAEFFAMGGYGVFVWASYGIAVVTLTITALVPLIRHRRLKASLRRRMLADQAESSTDND